MPAPSVSGTISQTAFPTRLVIEHAYRRCRLTAQVITGEMIDVAFDMLYLMLSDWANRGIGLWTIEKKILPLYQGQARLPCPVGTVDILNANLRTLTFLQFSQSNSANSILATLYAGSTTISTIGILWNGVALPCTLSGSNTNLPGSFATIGTIAPDTSNGNQNWFDFDGVPSYQYFQIAINPVSISLALNAKAGDTAIYCSGAGVGNVSSYLFNAGALTLPGDQASYSVVSAVYDSANGFTKVTLNQALAIDHTNNQAIGINNTLAIQTLSICNNPFEITIARINRDDYINLPNKTFQGRPLQYWYDRQRDIPIMTLWPSPNLAASMNQITIWRKRYIMDIGGVNDVLDIPQRWFDAVVYNLALSLAEVRPEVDPSIIPMVGQRANSSLLTAMQEERDNSPIYWTPNLRGYTR